MDGWMGGSEISLLAAGKKKRIGERERWRISSLLVQFPNFLIRKCSPGGFPEVFESR
jgi:hypothetical protein